MRMNTAPTTARERRDDSMSYGDRQSAVYQALIKYLGDGAADSTGEIDIWVQDCADDWVVWHSYTTSGPGPGDWKIGYVMDDSGGITFQGDPISVVSHVSYMPTDAAQLAATVGAVAAEVRSLRPVMVHRGPLTYNQSDPVSYFRDLWMREADNDRGAHRRLVSHAEELDRIAANPAGDEYRAYRAAGIELRTTPNRTQGTGGYFTVPLWLIEMFATFPRAGRVLADLMPCFPLPAGYSSVNVPRVATGTSTNSTTDNAAASETDVTDTASQRTVATITGISDWSLQSLEQSPPGAHLDWVVYKDLGESYDAQLETQLKTGTGTGNQLLGLINVPGAANQVVYTSASPTLTGMYASIGQLAAAIGKNRKLPPEAWLMTTARWAWIGSSEDTSQRPIVTPDVHPPLPKDGDHGAVSTDLGWAVYPDDSIPTNLGAGANQDTIICCRPSDMMLLEGAPQLLTSREPLAGTLGVRFRYFRYVDAITDRYPTAVATLSGTGMVPQAGF